jgi:hypothetical protein
MSVRPIEVKVEVPVGEPLEDAVRSSAILALTEMRRVSFTFNEITILIDPNDIICTAAKQYSR